MTKDTARHDAESDALRVFGYDDVGDVGRRAYIHSMAVQYLKKRQATVPHDLEELYGVSVRAWLVAIDSLHPAVLSAHEVSSAALPPRAATLYLSPDELPPEVEFTEADRRVLECLDLWPTLTDSQRELLIIRMAIEFVRYDYGGCVPEGLVRRAISLAHAAAACD